MIKGWGIYYMEQEAKKFLRKYRTFSVVIQYGLCLAAVVFVWLNIYFCFISNSICIVLVLLAMLLTRVVQVWYTLKIERIALEELNPPKMMAVIKTKGMYAYMPHRYLTAHYFNGDYQETINICNRLLKNKEKHPWIYYRYIAGVYFQIGDIENLKIACDSFESYRAVNSKIDLYCPLMKYYKMYANGEYESLSSFYESEEKSKYNKATYMTYEYIHAVNFYTLGKTEMAKGIFEKISKAAPLLSVGKLSAKQIKSIDDGNEYEINQTKILPDDDYDIPNNSKKAKIYRVIRMISLGLIVLMSVLVIILEFKQEQINDEQQAKIEEHQKRLQNAIDEGYDNFEILGGFNVQKGDKTIEYMVVFESENNELVVGYFVKYSDQTNGFIVDREGVTIGNTYYSDSPCSDYVIYYELYESKDDLPNNYCLLRELEKDGKDIYFCVTDIQ